MIKDNMASKCGSRTLRSIRENLVSCTDLSIKSEEMNKRDL